jgi:hypothetical protein
MNCCVRVVFLFILMLPVFMQLSRSKKCQDNSPIEDVLVDETVTLNSSHMLGTSVKLNPPPLHNISTKHFPRRPPHIHPHHNRHRPLLPLPIPIQRYRHRAQPSPHSRTQRSAKHLIEGALRREHFQPFRAVNAVYIYEREHCKESEVCGREECVREMCGERGAEEDLNY